MHKLSHVSPIITILPSLKLTVRPLKIGRNPKGNSSSNHAFSGAMLVSGRVLQGLYIPGNATFLPSTVPNDDFMFKIIPRVDSRRWKKHHLIGFPQSWPLVTCVCIIKPLDVKWHDHLLKNTTYQKHSDFTIRVSVYSSLHHLGSTQNPHVTFHEILVGW